MAEFYVFQTEGQAQSCINFINAQPYYPVRGQYRGGPAPDNKQKTERWTDAPREMVSGEWAVPRVPEPTLDYVGVPVEDRQAFLQNFGQDIRTLTVSDFTQPAEP